MFVSIVSALMFTDSGSKFYLRFCCWRNPV